MGGVSVEGGDEFLSFSHNHASGELLDRLIPVMAKRGYLIELDGDYAKRKDKYMGQRGAAPLSMAAPVTNALMRCPYSAPASPVPVPAAVWLFGTALIGLVGFSKRKSKVAV